MLQKLREVTMNKCRFQKELSSYLDNELSLNKKRAIEEHLKKCAICSQELSRLTQLSEKLKTWQPSQVSAGFERSVQEKIVFWELERGEVKMKKKTLAVLVPSSALVAILVLVFASQFYVKGMQGRLRDIDEQYEPNYAESKVISKPLAVNRTQHAYQQSLDYVSREEIGRSGALMGDYQDQKYAESLEARVVGGAENIVTPHGEGSIIVIQPTIPATGEGDKIIRTATVKLEVENGKETYKKASEICQELGGYLATSQFYRDRDGREAGTITMRIPKDKFTIALDRLGALGKVENIGTNSQDVGQEYANLKAELEAAMVVYNKTLEALQKRQTTIPEAMRLESELTPILRRVEGLKNKIEYLNNAVSFTTITVNFHEASVSVKALKESSRLIKESIMNAGINSVKFLAAALPVLVIGAILFGIAVVVVLVIKYWIIRIFKRG